MPNYSGPFAKALAIAQKNAAKPISEGGLGLRADNTAAERARALGFDTAPSKWTFHGSRDASDLREIDPARSDFGFHTGSIDQAEARLRAFAPPTEVFPSGAAIAPLVKSKYANMLRVTDPGSFHADGLAPLLEKKKLLAKGKGKQIQEAVDSDWKLREKYDPLMRDAVRNAGFDGLVYSNLHEGSGKSYAFSNPSMVRSPFAAFDPAKRNSNDMLGRVEAGALPALGATSAAGIAAASDKPGALQRFGQYARDIAQGASNSAAGLVSGPVDLTAWLARKAGVPVGDSPIGGSEWMARMGLTAKPESEVAGAVGEFAGNMLPFASGPRTAAALLKGGENLAARKTLNPQTGAIVWHGSPHKFDAFDAIKIGTGEGAQAYGHGLYLAEAPGVAQTYLGTGKAKAGAAAEARLVKQMQRAQDAGRYGEALAIEELLINRSPAKAVARFSAPDGGQQYRDALEALKKYAPQFEEAGNIYKVDLPDEHIAKMLDWDKPLSQQAPEVRNVLEKLQQTQQVFTTRQAPTKGMIEIVAPTGEGMGFYKPHEVDEAIQNLTAGFMRNAGSRELTGGQIVDRLQMAMKRLEADQLGGPVMDQAAGRDFYKAFGKAPTGQISASEALRQQGIPGIRYLDGGSRGAGSGTSNYVVFPGEESLLKILERNRQPLK